MHIQKALKIYTLLIILPVIFQCSSNFVINDSKPPINEFIYHTMKDVYLWNDTIPAIDYASYDNPEELFNALLNKDKDHWSFMYKVDRSLELEFGEEYGLGLYFMWVQNGELWDLRVGYVKSSSPAYYSKIQRGYTIVTINSQPVSGVQSIEEGSTNLQNAIANRDIIELKILDNKKTEQEITLQKDIYRSSAIGVNTTLTTAKGTVGYLEYRSFDYSQNPYEEDTNPYSDLDSAFSHFKNENIKDLIIDLRYNGGGSVDVSRHLASLIYNKEGEIFQKSYTNGRNFEPIVSSYFNSQIDYYYSYGDYLLRNLMPQQGYFTHYFDHTVTSTGLRRVIFITTEMSASASESLINSLRPFIEVIIIGQATHGKYVGMSGFSYNDYVFYPIMFKGYNAEGYGDFVDGLPADCIVEDNLDFQLGDVNEPCLKEALYYIENNRFSNTPAKSASTKEVPLAGLNRIYRSF